MTEQEDAPAVVAAEIGLQPGALAFLGLQVRVDDLGVDNDEVAPLMIERRVLVAEMVLPQDKMILLIRAAGAQLSVVTDIVIARVSPGRVAKVSEHPKKRRDRTA